MQTGETMNRMKKIGAFFAAGLLLVACAAGKKPAQSASKQQPTNYGNTMDTGRDRWKTGNRAFKGDACIFGSGKSFGQRVV
jgi:hypothetical protein